MGCAFRSMANASMMTLSTCAFGCPTLRQDETHKAIINTTNTAHGGDRRVGWMGAGGGVEPVPRVQLAVAWTVSSGKRTKQKRKYKGIYKKAPSCNSRMLPPTVETPAQLWARRRWARRTANKLDADETAVHLWLTLTQGARRKIAPTPGQISSEHLKWKETRDGITYKNKMHRLHGSRLPLLPRCELREGGVPHVRRDAAHGGLHQLCAVLLEFLHRALSLQRERWAWKGCRGGGDSRHAWP